MCDGGFGTNGGIRCFHVTFSHKPPLEHLRKERGRRRERKREEERDRGGERQEEEERDREREEKRGSERGRIKVGEKNRTIDL